MNALQRPGRVAAVVGAVVAVSATTLMAFVAGTASAAVPGRCTDNVNVREQPRPTATIVGKCRADQAVTVGEKRDGFVQLPELGGWASAEYVAVDGARSPRATTAPRDRGSATTAPRSTAPRSSTAPDSRSSRATPTPSQEAAPRGGSEAGDEDSRRSAPRVSPTATPEPTEEPESDSGRPDAAAEPGERPARRGVTPRVVTPRR